MAGKPTLSIVSRRFVPKVHRISARSSGAFTKGRSTAFSGRSTAFSVTPCVVSDMLSSNFSVTRHGPVLVFVLFGVLTYLVHGLMCNGMSEFHTGNIRVSVWSIPPLLVLLVFPLSSLSCVFYMEIYTLRCFYELTQAWPIIHQ